MQVDAGHPPSGGERGECVPQFVHKGGHQTEVAPRDRGHTQRRRGEQQPHERGGRDGYGNGLPEQGGNIGGGE
jgi:hypothetical protein